MKKLILILLLFTVFLQAQTLQNPTYGKTTTNTLVVKAPTTVTSVNFLPAYDTDGITFSKINPVLLPLTNSSKSYSDQLVKYSLEKNINTENIILYGVDSADGFTINTSGNVQPYLPGYKYKSFTGIISPNTSYVLNSFSATQGMRISYRDINNNVLGAYVTLGEATSLDGNVFQIHESDPIRFTTPANCVTILVNSEINGVDFTPTMTLTKGEYTYNYYKNFSEWVGYRIHWLGDSQTALNVLPNKVLKELKNINFLNGLSASLITPNFENIVGDGIRRPSFVERAKNNNLFPSDMIVVYGGYNDFGYGAPIGNISDMINPSFDSEGKIIPSSVVGATFYGSLNYIAKYFTSSFPSKPIKFITATYNGAADVSTYLLQEAYVKAMINVGLNNNIPVLDLFHGSGINSNNASSFTTDGLHFNDVGGDLVSKKVVPFINTSIGSSSVSIPIENQIVGYGVSGRIPFFNGTNSITSDSNFLWDNTNKKITVFGSSKANGFSVGTDFINNHAPLHVHVPGTDYTYLQFTNGDTGETFSDGCIFGIGNTKDLNIFNFENAKVQIGTNGIVRQTIDETGKTTFSNTVSGSNAVNPSDFLTKGQFDAAITPGIKRYKALISQSGTSAPTVLVLENSIGAIIWTRSATGSYTGTLSGAFTNNKTFTMLPISTQLSCYGASRTSDNTIGITTAICSTGVNTDGLLTSSSILIEVYP